MINSVITSKSSSYMCLKKITLMVVIFLMSFCQVLAIDIDKISYTLNTDTRTAIVTGCQNGVSILKIPHEVTNNGETFIVTEIGKSAFSGNTSITSVSIPSTVTIVNNGAFYTCRSLKEVRLEDGNEPIAFGYSYSGYYGSNPMFYYSPIEKVYIGRNITWYGEYYVPSPFKGKETLKEANIGETVTTLPQNCFENSAITKISIPNSVISIGDYSFSGCKSLSNVIFEDGDNELSLGYHQYTKQVFSGWEDVKVGLFYDAPLTSVYLGRDLKFSYRPFMSQDDLTDLTIGSNVTDISSISDLPIESITIPASVKAIKNYTFSGCTNLKRVTFSDSDTEISIGYNSYNSTTGKGLFVDCPLEYLYLGRNIRYSDSPSYGYSPFANQTSLVQIEFGSHLNSINNRCFYGCSNITTFSIPEQIINIGYEAFAKCTNLEQFKVLDSESLLNFGNSSSSSNYNGYFDGCKIKDIYIGRDISVTSSFSTPFRGSSTLNSVSIGNKVTQIPNAFFYECSSLETISIPETVSAIGENCFYGCAKLSNISLPSRLTNIRKGTFRKCTAITTIVLPQSITTIDDYAFSECSSLMSINLPEKLQSIGKSAFNDCSSIERIIFPSSIQNIENNAFNGCVSLSGISFSDGNGPLQLGYNQVSNIGLFGDSQINNIYIGRDLINTYSCTFLNKNIPNLFIELDSRVTSLPAYCFAECTGLDSIELPQNLRSIGKYCFKGCDKLNSITLPDELQTIEQYALYGCTNLEYVEYTPTNEFATIEGNVFEKNVLSAKQLIIHNTEKTLEATYDSMWSKFRNIVYKNNEDTYIPIQWNLELLTNDAIFSNELGCIVPKGHKATFNVNEEVFALHLENEISDKLNSQSGYTMLPDSYWAFNRLFIYSKGEYSKTVTLSEPGTLFNRLGLQSIQFLQGLTVSGDINGTDIMTINKMNSLKYLNLRNANIVEGGQTYRENYKTTNNTISTEFFYNLSNLQTLILPTTCEIIENNALKNRSSIYNIVLGDSLKTINEYAFNGCSSLFSITIPSNVTRINSDAFNGCTNLCNVRFDDSNNSISIHSGYNAPFSNCPIEKLYIGRNIEYGNSTGLFSNSKLQTLKFGDNVTSILKSMFEGCTQLENFDFPINLETIGSNAFYNCRNLSEVTIPNTVTEIPNNSFYNCVNLHKITLGSGVKTISENAFRYCSNVQKLLSLAELPPVITNSTFSSINKDVCQLIVTKGSLVNYWLDPIWSQFSNLSDELYYLNPLPDAKYGDNYIDLADYAPNGISFKYESSNPEVVYIDGTLLKIKGAGVATIAAIIPEEGTPMELIGQMRQFNISKRDLIVSVKDIVIKQGEVINQFEYIADGLCYDDTIEDIDNIPTPIHEVTDSSSPGEYAITFTKGYDNNYNIKTKNAKITVIASDASIDSIPLDDNVISEIFSIDGVKVYEGSLFGIHLPSGIYLIRQGSVVKKIFLTNK